MVPGRLGPPFGLVLLAACGGEPPMLPAGGGSGGDSSDATTAAPDGDGAPTSSGAEASSGSEVSSSGPADSTGEASVEIRLDVVVVVDNTTGMAAPQQRLAAALPGLVSALSAGADLLDVHLMITTTDMGQGSCGSGFFGTDPAFGSPVGTSCTERLADFEEGPFGAGLPEACTDVCDNPAVVDGAFLRFTDAGDNVLAGTLDDALRCLAPQGFSGCGYEAPLEAAYAALAPEACWNEACEGSDPPFLRADADLLIVMLTNELDCSLADRGIVTNPAFQNVDPATNEPGPSSAVCFNAGVSCTELAAGDYTDCSPLENGHLQPLSRYVDRIVSVPASAGKRLAFVPIVGVAPEGVDETRYRPWIGAEYPAGDIVPDEWAAGVDAADKIFQYGDLGPGCTEPARLGGHVQALPPVRIRDLCDTVDASTHGRCCPTSVCADAIDLALQCATDHLLAR